MILIGVAAMTAWVFPTFLAIDTGNIALIIAVHMIGGAVFSVSYGAAATSITELFDARVRFSASSTCFQFGALRGGAVAPLIATSPCSFARHRPTSSCKLWSSSLWRPQSDRKQTRTPFDGSTCAVTDWGGYGCSMRW